jgi:hypothetical protein
MKHLAFAATLLALGAAAASAQFPEQVKAGTRVRVWLPDEQQQRDTPWHRQLLRARVGSAGNDTLQLEVQGTVGSLAVSRAQIRRLDVSRGTSRAASAFERAFGGAVVGAIGTALRNDPGNRTWPHYDSDWRAAGEGAKWGAVFGAVIGFVIPTERWNHVRLR